jgi:hypothetical protein
MAAKNPNFGEKMKKKVSRPGKAGRSAPKSRKKPFRLEVGKTYVSRDGKLRARISRRNQGFTYPMHGDVLVGWALLNDWTDEGWYFEHGPGDERDLVREIPGAQRPAAAKRRRDKIPSLGTDNDRLVRGKK